LPIALISGVVELAGTGLMERSPGHGRRAVSHRSPGRLIQEAQALTVARLAWRCSRGGAGWLRPRRAVPCSAPRLC
jgi:hypothetical protein